MEPVTLALLFGGALLLGSKKKGSRSKSTVTYGRKMTHEQRLAMMIEIRKMSAYASSRFGMMPYLADYLTAVGFRESRFNPTIANPEIRTNPKNAARGLFQMRPKTAFKNELEFWRSKPNLLFNPIIAFCTAVDYIAEAEQTKGARDWVAVKRWWACPHVLVNDYDEVKSGCGTSSIEVRQRLEKSIEDVNREYGANINEDFIWAPIQSGGYPGIKPLLNAFGVKI